MGCTVSFQCLCAEKPGPRRVDWLAAPGEFRAAASDHLPESFSEFEVGAESGFAFTETAGAAGGGGLAFEIRSSGGVA